MQKQKDLINLKEKELKDHIFKNYIKNINELIFKNDIKRIEDNINCLKNFKENQKQCLKEKNQIFNKRFKRYENFLLNIEVI